MLFVKASKRVVKRLPLSRHPMELMENRVLLSAVQPVSTQPALEKLIPTIVSYSADPNVSVASRLDMIAAGTSTAYGLSAGQVRSAYGLGLYTANTVNFTGSNGTISGIGTGQTIALIDAYNDPTIVSDLTAFDARFQLPDPPSFQVLNQGGDASPLPSSDAGWSTEESLDVEWAHVMAPGANIILFEANSSYNSDLFAAAATAADTPGVSVASMSFGGGEFNGETSDDSDFVAPSGHAPVTFFASTGDSGAELEYPAQSPNVVAVGGTDLSMSSYTYAGETAWSSGGGGTSAYESQPSYQAGTITSSNRETPDVSIIGGTGVPIYDSYAEGASTPWAEYDGTSLSSPSWAGIVAVAQQGRVAEGLPTLSSTQTLTRLYQATQYSTLAKPNPAATFRDITSGSNGHLAGTGYDEATGIGTPIINYLVPDLAGTATVTGRIFADAAGTGVYQTGDAVFANQTVYLDLNNDGKQDDSEPSTTTNAQGLYTFTDEPAGGTVRLSNPSISGYLAIPASASLAYGATNTVNFTYFPLSFNNTSAAINYTLQTDATNTNDQILINGTLTYSVAESVLAGQALSFNLTGTGDSFTVNATTGNPLPSGGITLSGPAGGLPLRIIGTATGNDTYNVSSASVAFDSVAVTATKFSSITLSPGAGTSSLTVNSGSATVAAQSSGGVLTRNFSNISIAANSSVAFATAPSHSSHTLVETSTLSVLGQLDLGGNDLIVHNGNLATITSLLATGYSNGLWNGQGIASSAAHNDTTYLTALGAIQNTIYGGSGQSLFDGTAPLTTDVLIKYTYYGDANLDGKIDGTDYSRIDGAHGTAASGWYNGDFNYDHFINGSDYTLMDNDYNTQGASLAAQIASPAAMISAPSSISTSSRISTAVFQSTWQISLSNQEQSAIEKQLAKQDVIDRLKSL